MKRRLLSQLYAQWGLTCFCETTFAWSIHGLIARSSRWNNSLKEAQIRGQNTGNQCRQNNRFPSTELTPEERRFIISLDVHICSEVNSTGRICINKYSSPEGFSSSSLSVFAPIAYPNHCLSLAFYPWLAFFLLLGAVLCSQAHCFLRTRSWKAIHWFLNASPITFACLWGKGIPGAVLQYHLYANLFRLW